jgi:hypothetical protein
MAVLLGAEAEARGDSSTTGVSVAIESIAGGNAFCGMPTVAIDFESSVVKCCCGPG